MKTRNSKNFINEKTAMNYARTILSTYTSITDSGEKSEVWSQGYNQPLCFAKNSTKVTFCTLTFRDLSLQNDY